MREIKFRAYDTYNKEMLCIDNLDFTEKEMGVRTVQYTDYFNTNEMILMQFTGLKDKNGVEIYEGDILRGYEDEIEDWVISFEDGKFVGKFDNLCVDLYDLIDIEVIGNIYDNKDLIKGE